jgi:hypothetical protein
MQFQTEVFNSFNQPQVQLSRHEPYQSGLREDPECSLMLALSSSD